ncbi:response regulator [Noviherbaspirillum pedocola]|uniref:Response regulator n=1 Tax=Noviherbaspirillum pedocola TaxID=2801341 RepID=A0A934W932_9BURK|nr:response regulator [Noviherbaspirillum pedocola]MBK4737548.1 response regulator [Noviherbaspirillum pedocola]
MDKPIHALIVDDDNEIRTLLCNYLADFGIDASGAQDGAAMRRAMVEQQPDVIILDLMLPGEDGLTLCRQLRAAGDIPIIMLTARGEAADRVVGLELGADDYVVKPFDPRELVARVHTVLRRARPERKRDDSSGHDEDVVSFEGWVLHVSSRQLTTPRGMIVPLSNAEFRLLWTFIQRPRRVLTRDQLMDAARGQASTAFDRSIDLLVSRLRQKLDEDPRDPKILKTIRGEGYLFDARIAR